VTPEEVYVYAEKREASIEDTALSVTAIDATTLTDSLSFDFKDLGRLTVPRHYGVSFRYACR